MDGWFSWLNVYGTYSIMMYWMTIFGGNSYKTIRNMDVSENNGTPKSSILIGISIINHPFWGTPIFENTHISWEKVWQYLGELSAPLN